MTEPRILVVTGVMASGKSTVSELLARQLPRAVHLRGDAFRKMIVSGRVEMSAEADPEAVCQLELRYRITASAARQYWEAGFTVVAQDNYLGGMLPFFVELLAPAPVEVIVLCPDVDAVRKREALRDKRGYTGFTVEDMHAAFLEETPRIGLWLDTSGDTADQTVHRILDYLKSI